ncbi:MAG: hydroxymethylglutaryl-CoA synthase [Holosporaceae bacterium]|jgi:hydroxymethylglutaryl-CoA synthase|nr:hydroxymethylglutaryl-CoA synthase [Holosporaceae bacterium]
MLGIVPNGCANKQGRVNGVPHEIGKARQMKVGIDSIAFSTSKYFLKLETLALHRREDYEKYYVGIGQKQMSVFPPNEDIVTIAVDAAQKAVAEIADKNDIDMLIFATESSFDLSKSAGIYVHHFLQLKENCRVFDIKQACYSATAALQLSKSYVMENPSSRVLVVASDIVKYQPNTSGEPTQGGAAVAMIVSKDPRILTLEQYSGIHTTDVMDFWKPVYKNEALFDSKLSVYNYLKSLNIALKRYFDASNSSISDLDCVCYHAPFGKMARKADQQTFRNKFLENSLIYGSLIGNSCSASIYVCLLSLLDNTPEDLDEKRIGFFSYGSGSVAEFFSGIVSRGYRKMLSPERNFQMIENRMEISFEEYERFSSAASMPSLSKYQNIGSVTLAKIENDKRVYAASC